MLSDESKSKVERLITFSTGVFNKHRPSDFYIYYHPSLYLYDSFESWSKEDKRIQQLNLQAKRKLNSKVHKISRKLQFGQEPFLIPSLNYFDKSSNLSSGTFKVGVTNSSAILTREERAYLNELKKSAKRIGFQPHKFQFSRNRDHKMHGWTRIKHIKFDTGEEALFVEREILQWVRKDLKSAAHLTKKHLPQAGWTETIDASEVPLPILWAKVLELSKVKK